MSAETFYEVSAAAAACVGRRAVLIVGNNPENRPESESDRIICVEYAPFEALFARAEAIIHAGGIGTTALALRAGRPMLVMPLAHDQFDNARRVERLGVACTVSKSGYKTRRVAGLLQRILNEPNYSERAKTVQQQIRKEDGVQTACDALEELMSTVSPLKPVGRIAASQS
jgi:UDP:flavonoid glycosyltransferase YjiC (YdhE family)